MKTLVLAVVGFLLVGCGGGGTSPSPSSNPGTAPGSGTPQVTSVLQNGQWEFTFPSANQNVPPAYMEANLSVTDAAVSAAPQNVEGYAPYYQASAWQQTGNGTPILFPDGYITAASTRSADQYFLQGSTSSGLALAVGDNSQSNVISNLIAPLTTAVVTSLTGTFNLVVPGPTTPWAFEAGYGNGTFTATAIQPVNGSFSGILKTSAGGTDQVTLNITQNVYDITLTGSASASGNSASLNIPSGISLTGAVFSGTGSFTTANGVKTFSIGAHIHPDGNSLDIVLNDDNGAGGGLVEWGTISKAGH